LFVPAVLLARRFGVNNPADARAVTVFDPLYAFYAYAVGFSLGPSTADLHGELARVLPHYALTIAITAVVFGALVIAGVAAAMRLPARSRNLVLTWLGAPLAIALAAAMATANPFNVRYAIVAFPAFLLVVALGAGALLAWRRAAGIAVVAAALALSAGSLAHLYFDAHYAKEDCRGLAVVLHADATPEDLILVNAPYMESAVRFYYPGPATVQGYPRQNHDLESTGTRDELATLTAGRPHVWLVLTRTFQG